LDEQTDGTKRPFSRAGGDPEGIAGHARRNQAIALTIGHESGPRLALPPARSARLFRSFLMGGFESSSHRRAGDGRQLDLIAATRHDRHALDDYRLLAAHFSRI
jgi:hypothetical protein